MANSEKYKGIFFKKLTDCCALYIVGCIILSFNFFQVLSPVTDEIETAPSGAKYKLRVCDNQL